MQAAIQGAEELQNGEFAGFNVGLLHGRMNSAEKEAVMADFKSGKIQVLVATTVIEVGVGPADPGSVTVLLASGWALHLAGKDEEALARRSARHAEFRAAATILAGFS